MSVDAQSIRDEVPGPQSRRRLVIMGIENHSDLAGGTQLEEMSGEDVSDGDDAMAGQSDVEVGPIPANQAPDATVTVQVERLAASFEWLSSMDLEFLFQQRPCLMKSVPDFMKGSYRAAMRVALRLFLILLRLLLHRPPRGGERSRRFNCSEE